VIISNWGTEVYPRSSAYAWISDDIDRSRADNGRRLIVRITLSPSRTNNQKPYTRHHQDSPENGPKLKIG
ncbi:MAG: hypothetical protein JXN62_08460, partial [Bacteroidales bacterium]|nr:hypothetical protein [Bacteroidales bacterium]